MRIACSCLQDVRDKVDEIKNAKDAVDSAVEDGTFRSATAASLRQGSLQART